MNPAERLLATHDKIVNQPSPNGLIMVKMWTAVFGVTPDTPSMDDEVVTCLQALRSEIDFVRAMLAGVGVPAELTITGFERLRQISSPAYIHGAWDSYKGNVLPPENRLALQWAVWVLRDENERDMSADDLQGLRTEIEALEASLRDIELTPFLRDFVQRQVDAIRSALKVYNIQGSRSLHEALRTVVGDYKVAEKTLKAELESAPGATKGMFAKATSIVKKTAEICDNLVKIKKGGEEAFMLATTVGPLVLPYLGNILK